jgi:hypothetical protein
MKIKSLLIIIITILGLSSGSSDLYSQQVSPTYTGTWHYDNGNQRFIVKIWQENEDFLGHYKIIGLNNGVPGNTILDSRQLYPHGQRFDHVVYAGFSEEFGLSGFIYDNTIIGNDSTFKRGDLHMKMIMVPQNCQGCVVTAAWKITKPHGMIIGINHDFSIPTDVILTKVSNTVTWD